MMPIAKHFDPMLGVDIHVVTTPAGPIPIPHPHLSLVMDLFDYLPVLGSNVMVGGVKRAAAGTAGRSIPHIPMGGPFVKPPGNEDEVFMGSATVLADSEPLSFTAMPVIGCQDIGMLAPMRKKPKKTFGMVLPTSLVIAIPTGLPVTVGGPPTVNMAAVAGRAGMAALGKAFKKLKSMQRSSGRAKRASAAVHRRADSAMNSLGISAASRTRNRVHRSLCTVTGHPVDVAAGKLFTEFVDFALPGPLPLAWERVWFSTSDYRGPLGYGWHHAYDLELVEANKAVTVRLADGRGVVFPPLKPGDTSFDRAEQLTLIRDADGYALDQMDGIRYRFLPLHESEYRHKLHTVIQKSTGAQVRMEYDSDERLRRIIDSAGRCIRLEYEGPWLTSIWLPETEKAESWYRALQYHYRDEMLVAVDDAAGQRLSYAYDNKLLVQETYRNGLSFYFRFDRADADARCIETWGDGGIYYRSLEYDLENQITHVVDGLGHRVDYHHDGVVPHKVVNAKGYTTSTQYNEYHQIVSETDELGHSSHCVYDDSGHLIQVTDTAGAATQFTYDERNNLVQRENPLGDQWAYEYDGENRLIRETDPQGGSVHYAYESGLLAAMVDQAGQRYRLEYDCDKNLVRISDGRERCLSWQYDRQGNVLASTDPRGNVRRFHHDVLGRVVRIEEPDGNVRHIAYDTQNFPVHIQDRHTDVQFEYQGMGRLAARSQGGTTVKFEYDREEQLIAIANEHGRVYRFELDAGGKVQQESGFDGLIRRYERDGRGQIKRIDRPEGRFSEYQYDPMGRVTQVLHDSGEREQYQYRADGALIKARNSSTKLQWERDALGRPLKEIQGKDWVANTYDASGNRVRVQSSLGLDQRIARDQSGEVMEVTLNGGAEDKTDKATISTQFTRDLLGLELQRTMPGGLQSRWQRDSLGRPTRHDILGDRQTHRARSYVWGKGDRLEKIIDHLQGETRLKHDTLGNLVDARYSDSVLELRMPDAVGNLFRTEAQRDREYGPAGQLLAVQSKQGTTRYHYDAQGNLVRKTTADDQVWQYQWNATGQLQQVTRPDGRIVTFVYDPLGRRIRKCFAGKTTHWVWDGDNPLHEWVVHSKFGAPKPQRAANDAERDEIAADQRAINLQPLQAQGPPDATGRDHPITWVFEPGSFAPMGKQVGEHYYPIVTDHMGTPVAMFDDRGGAVWSADISVWGELRNLQGERHTCPFRWPGQYEDEETGLYYNRFRYYDPEAGQYCSQDPIGLGGGLNHYAYVPDPNQWADPLGLANANYGASGSASFPSTSAVPVSGSRAIDRGQSYEVGVRGLYGGVPFNQRQYDALVNGQWVSGVADNVTNVGGRNVAIEAKFVDSWAASLRNPACPIGSRPWALAEQQQMISQATKYSAAFDEVIYHTNSVDLATHYSKVFSSEGITNYKFVITPIA